MIRAHLLFFLCALLPFTPVQAEELKPAPDSALVGMYALQGVRETGSLMELGADGRFALSLTYGSTDRFVRGTWQRDQQMVILASDRLQPLKIRLSQPGEYKARYQPKPGYWVVVVVADMIGPIGNIAVQFSGRSGFSANAVTGKYGDAAVEAPSGEQWLQVELRRNDAADEWVKLNIPSDLSNSRFAALMVEDAEYMGPPFFDEMRLDIAGRRLRVLTNGEANGAEYVRH